MQWLKKGQLNHHLWLQELYNLQQQQTNTQKEALLFLFEGASFYLLYVFSMLISIASLK